MNTRAGDYLVPSRGESRASAGKALPRLMPIASSVTQSTVHPLPSRSPGSDWFALALKPLMRRFCGAAVWARMHYCESQRWPMPANLHALRGEQARQLAGVCRRFCCGWYADPGPFCMGYRPHCRAH